MENKSPDLEKLLLLAKEIFGSDGLVSNGSGMEKEQRLLLFKAAVQVEFPKFNFTW